MASRNLASQLVGADTTQPAQNKDTRVGRTVQQQKTSTKPIAAQKETPYAIQVSQARRTPACPYHTPIVDAQCTRVSAGELTPMERFLCASRAEQPVALFEGVRVGTAASGGCTCGEARQRQWTAML